MNLEGKVALVTGEGMGVGEAIAERLAREGADVVIDNRARGYGPGVLRRVRATGRRGVFLQGALGTVGDDFRMVAHGIEAFGKLDILVNHAAMEKQADFWNVSEAEYDAVLRGNLKGVFFATQAFVRHLRENKRPGKIINISSVHEELPAPRFSACCISKGGLRMLMRSLAIELAPLGITVNNVAPGAIETPPLNSRLLDSPDLLRALLDHIPLNHLGEPADVAGAVAFLASPDADYITGATLIVDGGLLWNRAG